MAIPQDMQQAIQVFKQNFRGDKLDEIKASNGGSLMDLFGKVRSSQTPTLIIGLGGLGCRTVNEIKHKYLVSIKDGKESGKDKHVYFLAVDTDQQNTLSTLEKASATGWLEADELHSVIKNGGNQIFHFLTHAKGTFPEQSWIDYQLNRGTIIDDQGAQTTRQVGRIGLSIDDNYDALYQAIQKKLIAMQSASQKAIESGFNPAASVIVILIAGISGGTGSGTIMDVSYMIHKAAAETGGKPLQLDAILYTPDVQMQNPAIQNKKSLKRNFAAAMKEIDTFFKANDNNTEYRFQRSSNPTGEESTPTMAGPTVGQSNMFSSCTLVQGYNSAGAIIPDAEIVAMDTVANYVINIIGDYNAMKGDAKKSGVKPGEVTQALSAVLNNERTFAEVDANALQDAMPSLPRDYKYKYRAIGFRSLNFPVGELMTYLANQMTIALCKEYDKRPAYNALSIMYTLELIPSEENLPSRDEAFEALYDLGDNLSFQRSLVYDYEFDQLHDTSTIEALGVDADTPFDSKWVDAKATALIQYLKKEMTYQANGGGGNGPFAAVRLSNDMEDILDYLLSAYSDDTISEFYKSQMNASRDELDSLLRQIHGTGKRDPFKIATRRELTAAFNDELHNYMIWWWKHETVEFVVNAIIKIRKAVIDQNSMMWNFAVGAFLAIAEIMEHDSTVAMNTAISSKKNGTNIFSMDILNLSDLNDNTSNLAQLMDRYLNADRIKQLCEDLTQDMLETENKDAWTTNGAAFDVVKRVREVFNKQFSEFAEDQLEKLLIVQYAKLNPNFTLDNLLQLMDQWLDNPPAGTVDPWDSFEKACEAAGVTSPLDTAADAIFKEARQVGRCAAMDPAVPAGADFGKLFTDKRLCLNEMTPHINEKIKVLAPADVLVGKGTFPGVLYSEVACGVPLYFFRGFIECQEAYTVAMHTPGPGNAGLHMDADLDVGWANFPPLLSNDMLRLRDPEHLTVVMERTDYKDEEKILSDIKSYADFGLDDKVGMFTFFTPPAGTVAVPHFILHALSDVTEQRIKKDSSILTTMFESAIQKIEQAVQNAFDNMPKVNPNAQESYSEAWIRTFNEEFKRPTIIELLQNEGCKFDDIDIDISQICPKMDMVSTGDINNSNEGGLYKTIRSSAKYRSKLATLYGVTESLKKAVDDRIEEMCTPQLKKFAAQDAKRKASDILEFYVKAILTKHIVIEYEQDDRILNVSYYYSSDDYDVIIGNLKLNSAQVYERRYYPYAVFTEFLNWVSLMKKDELNGLKAIVDEDFDEIWDKAFRQGEGRILTKNLLCYLDDSDDDNIAMVKMNFGTPGTTQQRLCESIDGKYDSKPPKVFRHLIDSALYSQSNGDGFGARVIGYYAAISECISDLGLKPFSETTTL